MKQIELLETIISYTFKNKSLLIEAMTHPSLSGKKTNPSNYQRLEFLGDKVLGFIVARKLFSIMPKATEGEISKKHSEIICGTSCSDIAFKIGLERFVLLAQSQEKDGGRSNPKILENALEALIGAIYIDSNLETAEAIVLKLFEVEKRSFEKNMTNAKSILQEWMQKNYAGKTPIYKSTQLPDGTFEVTAIIEVISKTATGNAKTIKDAQKIAATKLIKELGIS